MTQAKVFVPPFKIVDAHDVGIIRVLYSIQDANGLDVCYATETKHAEFILKALIDQQQLNEVLDANNELKTLLGAASDRRVEEVSTVVQDYDKIIEMKDKRINQLIDQLQQMEADHALEDIEYARIRRSQVLYKQALNMFKQTVAMIEEIWG